VTATVSATVPVTASESVPATASVPVTVAVTVTVTVAVAVAASVAVAVAVTGAVSSQFAEKNEGMAQVAASGPTRFLGVSPRTPRSLRALLVPPFCYGYSRPKYRRASLVSTSAEILASF